MKIQWKSFIIGLVIGAALITLLDNRYITKPERYNNSIYSVKMDRWTGASWIFNSRDKQWVPMSDFSSRRASVEAKRLNRATKRNNSKNN